MRLAFELSSASCSGLCSCPFFDSFGTFSYLLVPADILYKRPPNVQNPNLTPAQTVPNSEHNPNATVNSIQSDSLKNNDQITATISERPVETHHEMESAKLVPTGSSISPNRSVSMNICPTSSSSSSHSVSALGNGGKANSVLASSVASNIGGAQMPSSAQEQEPLATLALIELFETILPVISDTDQDDQVNLATPIGNQFSTTNTPGPFANPEDFSKRIRLLSGKFEVINIQSRRLSFMRREFNTVSHADQPCYLTN